MDRHTHSAQVERLAVVDTGRRRRWSEDEKLKIVLESLQVPRQVSATARRHGISRSQLLQWRRTLRAMGTGADAEQRNDFVPAVVVAELQPPVTTPATSAGGGAIEIEFARGARVRVTGAVDASVLNAVIAALSGGHPR